MERKQYEQEFVNKFYEYMTSSDKGIEFINHNCRAKKYADIEYRKANDLYRIEVKTHLSNDRDNAAHKIFGELLKMTKFDNDEKNNIHYGVLIDDRKVDSCTGSAFFSRKFNEFIDREKFLAFGKIFEELKVITFNPDTNDKKEYSWEDFYNYTEE